jgi:hypothetical protein
LARLFLWHAVVGHWQVNQIVDKRVEKRKSMR